MSIVCFIEDSWPAAAGWSMIGDNRAEEHGERNLSQHNPSGHRGGRWGPWWLRWKQHYSYFYTGVSPAVLYLFDSNRLTICLMHFAWLFLYGDQSDYLFRYHLWLYSHDLAYLYGALISVSHIPVVCKFITYNRDAEVTDRTDHYQTHITYRLLDGCGAGCVRETGVFLANKMSSWWHPGSPKEKYSYQCYCNLHNS